MARRTPHFYEEITDAALSTYLRRIVKIPLLSKAEELHLAKQIHKGDEKALKKLVESNLRFVVKVALQYQGYGLSLLDLINEGNLGLLEASRRFSPDYNVKFITYAVWWIRQAIMQALARAASLSGRSASPANCGAAGQRCFNKRGKSRQKKNSRGT